jgi:hypothetical protein
LAAAAVALPAAGADAAAGAGTDVAAGQPGAWRSQKTELVYLGFTSHYSCDGLQDKLELLLRQLGARRDFKVIAYGCDRGYGQPSRFPRAALEFATLQPGSADAAPVPSGSSGPSDDQPVAGAWRSVELSPRHPFELQDGDCELMEQFRDKVLPLFAVRNLQANLTCVPHQDNGPFALQMQVFAPLVTVKPK